MIRTTRTTHNYPSRPHQRLLSNSGGDGAACSVDTINSSEPERSNPSALTVDQCRTVVGPESRHSGILGQPRSGSNTYSVSLFVQLQNCSARSLGLCSTFKVKQRGRQPGRRRLRQEPPKPSGNTIEKFAFLPVQVVVREMDPVHAWLVPTSSPFLVSARAAHTRRDCFHAAILRAATVSRRSLEESGRRNTTWARRRLYPRYSVWRWVGKKEAGLFLHHVRFTIIPTIGLCRPSYCGI